MTIELLQAISIASTLLVGGGFIWAIKAQGMVQSTRLDGIDRQIASIEKDVKKMGDVLVLLAEQSGRINLMEERQLAQGKRLDDTTARLNRHIEMGEGH